MFFLFAFLTLPQISGKPAKYPSLTFITKTLVVNLTIL